MYILYLYSFNHDGHISKYINSKANQLKLGLNCVLAPQCGVAIMLKAKAHHTAIEVDVCRVDTGIVTYILWRTL